MPEIDPHRPGSFCWVELATPGQEGAKSFYASLFGWTAADFPMGDGSTYTMFQLEGMDAGAAYLAPAGSRIPPSWSLYVAVTDADATARQAAALGAKLFKEPFDVWNAGRMAVISDPTGAVFCIWEAKQSRGFGISGEPGAFCWADLNTGNPAKAKAFYEALFGWKMVAGKNDPSGYLHIQNGDDMIGGVPPRVAEQGAHWLVYF